MTATPAVVESALRLYAATAARRAVWRRYREVGDCERWGTEQEQPCRLYSDFEFTEPWEPCAPCQARAALIDEGKVANYRLSQERTRWLRVMDRHSKADAL